MKQILQDFRTGQLKVHEVPVPMLRPGGVLVRTHHSLISGGTEGETVRLARRNLLEKARSRPDLVRKVLNVARTDGILSAYEAVVSNLDAPVPLGYSLAGEVVEVGRHVEDLAVGQRVACFGSMIANHAEVNFVPRNLCVRLPDSVSSRHGAFGMLGAIAINGVRRAHIELGSRVLVIGLGLIGQITIQLLKAAGCRVTAVDLDSDKIALAEQSGANVAIRRNSDNLEETILAESDGLGVDATIITAASRSSDPIALAGQVTRQKGRVIAVGRVPYELPRDDYLFKELDFATSFAFGPGVNDPAYELQGVDYPAEHVRWTGKRNVESFLQLIADEKMCLDHLITHEFEAEKAKKAYTLLTNPGDETVIAMLLRFSTQRPYRREPISLRSSTRSGGSRRPGIGVIGAGSHAVSMIFDAIDTQAIEKRGIASAGGFRSKWYGKKYGFSYAASDVQQLLDDDQIDALLVLSRHDSHADITVRCLEHGKHVFVEKPLCLNLDQLARLQTAHQQHGGHVMVGFNRRFAPLGRKLRKHYARHAQPLSVIYRMNAGVRPASHWLHDIDVGGGLILGEGIHFLDFMQFIVAARPRKVTTHSVDSATRDIINPDTLAVTVEYADGSIGTMHYLSNGDKTMGRERVEVYGDNSTAVLDDWRLLNYSKNGKRTRTRRQLGNPKGFIEEMKVFINALSTKNKLPMTFAEAVDGMQTALAAIESLRTGQACELSSLDMSPDPGEKSGDQPT